MGIPLQKMHFGGKPPHGHGHHRPYHHWNDTECAVEVPPWEDCCGEGDECVCLTSADTAIWDDVVNTVATNSGIWGGQEPSPIPESSAAIWNDTYEVVSNNSAKWNDTTVADNSAKWNEISELSGAIKEVQTVSPLLGDGTIDNPLHIDQLKLKQWDLIERLSKDLYVWEGENLTPDWVPFEAFKEHEKKYNELHAAWQRNELVDKQQWDAISRIGKQNGSYEFRYVKDMTPDNLAEYCEPNVIYYTDKW